MNQLTYADRSLLTGDDAAERLLRYAAALTDENRSDTVSLNVYGPDGDELNATFLLGQGTNLMTTSTHSNLPEPNNTNAVIYMDEQLASLLNPHLAVVEDFEPFRSHPDDEFDL